MIDLEAIEARLAAATPRPWQWHGYGRISTKADDTIIAYSSGANAVFILHAPADIAALIGEVRRLRGAAEDRV